jgi:hypothetical protein
MPCPLCKATSDVTLTRLVDGAYVRTRECFNEHIFKTKEVVVAEPRLKRSTGTNGIRSREQQAKR